MPGAEGFRGALTMQMTRRSLDDHPTKRATGTTDPWRAGRPRPSALRAACVLALTLGVAACDSGAPAPPPTVAPAVVAEAEALLRSGDLDGLVSLLEPRDPASLTPRAALLLAIGLHESVRYGAAEPYFAQALSADPPVDNRAGGVHFHAWCLFQLGRLDEARARFEEHAALDPREGDTPLGLGRIALAQGRLDEARGAFRRSAELHAATSASGRADRREEEGRALAWLSDVEVESGDLPAARTALETSLTRFPYSRGAWTKLHEVCLALDDQDAAAKALAKRDELDALREQAARAAGAGAGGG